jgi:hypothetical protein
LRHAKPFGRAVKMQLFRDSDETSEVAKVYSHDT